MMDRYRLRAASSGDEHTLRELFATVFGEHRTSEEWRWKYGASCALAASAGYQCADSIVALDEAGTLVAHAGALTLPGWREGVPIPIVQVCDVMVHSEHRGGLGRNNLFTLMLRELLARTAERLPTAFRYGFPGQRPYLIGERSGVYERLGMALESRLSGSSCRWNNLWRAAPLDWCDARIDALWERLSDQCRLGLIRDRAYLRWRYADNPSHDYRLYGLSRFGRLAGWGVCTEGGAEPSLVDLWLPSAAVRQALPALAARVESDLSLSGIRAWLPPDYRAALGVPGIETPVVVANMRWATTIPTEVARDLLYYTMGDVDIF